MTDPSHIDPLPYDDEFAAVSDLDPDSWAVLDAEAAVQLREDAIAAYDERVAEETFGFFESQFLTADERVLGLPEQVSASDLIVLDEVDPATLSDPLAVLAYIARTDAVTSLVAAKRLDAVVALVGVVPKLSHLKNVHLEQELALARRTSMTSAGLEIERARALRQMFGGFAAALAAGQISPSHVAILVEKCRVVADPDILAAIETLVLPKARRLPPGKFAAQVSRAIATLDPDAASRRKEARKTRDVWFRPADDGMGLLTIYGPVEIVRAAFDRITVDGRALQLARGGASAANDDDATAGACRADAGLARLLGETRPDGSVTFDPSHADITLDVVMTEASIAAGEDGLALVNDEPVPAAVARDYARFANARRRALVDPVTGHLIDHGRKVYLPEDLRRYLLARDGGCIGPVCNTRHRSRLQMEHGIPFPDGPSNTTNCRIWCTTEHHLKTDGHLDITDLKPDGSATWLTRFGQRLEIPPRPFLDIPPPLRSAPTEPPTGTIGDDARPRPDAEDHEPPELEESPFWRHSDDARRDSASIAAGGVSRVRTGYRPR